VRTKRNAPVAHGNTETKNQRRNNQPGARTRPRIFSQPPQRLTIPHFLHMVTLYRNKSVNQLKRKHQQSIILQKNEASGLLVEVDVI
jgi:hypothetical protein